MREISHLSHDTHWLCERSQTFSTKSVEKTILTLEPLIGRLNVNALIHQLQTYGFGMTGSERSYTLAGIQRALEEIFGEEAMLLLLRYITNRLFEEE